jgi:hypothetical protein
MKKNWLYIIEQWTVLRSLKLIGNYEWIVSILAKFLNAKIRIEQRIMIITLAVRSLDRTFDSIGLTCSLVCLEIYANEYLEYT